MRKSLLLISILLLLISNLYAQNIGFNGIVTGKDNTPLKEAVVVVIDAVKSTALYTTITDSLGRYTIPKSTNKITINISHIGFVSTTFTISLSDYPNNTIESILEPMELDMKEITVYGAAPKIKREGGKFVMDNASNSPFAKGNDSYTFLKYMPILNVKPEGGISIMGKGDASIQINGKTMPGMKMEDVLRSIPASDIEKIEIIAIPGSAYSANNRNGILNIILKKHPNEGVQVNVSLADSHRYINSQRGSAYLSYANQKINITSGFSADNNRYMVKSNEDYRYLNEGLNTHIDSGDESQVLYLSGFFNIDYNINKKQMLGARVFVNSRDVNNYNSSTSYYRSISNNTLDSVYTSFGKTRTPHWNIGWGANINYNLKTSDDGSMLKIDLNYRNNNTNNETHSIYEKILDGNAFVTNNFLQKRYKDLNSFGFKAEHKQIFNSDSKLTSGVALYYGKNYNDYLYGYLNEKKVINDPKRSNTFLYDDITFAAFLSYEQVWSDKFESVVGLRAESYTANGIQKADESKISRREFGLFPSLSLIYLPNDDHELSLDFSRSISRPSYTELNPFITYLSPTTYKEGNPNIKSGLGYEVMLSYSFLDNYMISIDYMYDTDLATEIMIPAGNSMTKIKKLNYGNSHAIVGYINAKHSLFNRYWNISANFDIGYDMVQGDAEGMKIDFSGITYSLTINNNIVLSKKSKWSAYLKYQYSSAGEYASSSMKAMNSMEVMIMKQFKGSSLSFGAYNIFNAKINQYKTTPDYSFNIIKNRYVVFYVNYTISFGNKKVKQISDRHDSKFQNRLN